MSGRGPSGRALLADPLLWVALLMQVLVQLALPVRGDTVETVDGVVRDFNNEPLLTQLLERAVAGAGVAALTLVLPVLARRSVRRGRGRPTTTGGLGVLFDLPWHRDPVLWLAGVLAAVPLLGLAGPSGYGEQSAGPGEPTVSREVVTGSYLDGLAHLLALPLAFVSAALLLGAIRLIFRLLGGQRPWRGAPTLESYKV